MGSTRVVLRGLDDVTRDLQSNDRVATSSVELDHANVTIGLDGESHDVLASHPKPESAGKLNSHGLLPLGHSESMKSFCHLRMVANLVAFVRPRRAAR